MGEYAEYGTAKVIRLIPVGDGTFRLPTPADEGGGGGGGGGLTDDELRASDVFVSLDGESVRVIDAAELPSVIAAPFTISAAGTATIVAAPGGSSLLRLRSISPTYAIRSPDTEPILSLSVGAVEVLRGNTMTRRFDVTAAADTDAITLDVDALDGGGAVVGTVFYEVV